MSDQWLAQFQAEAVVTKSKHGSSMRWKESRPRPRPPPPLGPEAVEEREGGREGGKVGPAWGDEDEEEERWRPHDGEKEMGAAIALAASMQRGPCGCLLSSHNCMSAGGHFCRRGCSALNSAELLV